MAPNDRPLSRASAEALALIGARVREGRIARRWTAQELADRIGITRATLRKVERGDPSVAVGIVFEAATLTGVTLFSDDAGRRALERARTDDRLALLPRAVRAPRVIDDDF